MNEKANKNKQMKEKREREKKDLLAKSQTRVWPSQRPL